MILLVSRDRELLGVLRPEGLLLGVELAAVASFWWLGVSSSPLVHREMQPVEYYPLVTAMLALAVADVNERLGRRRSWDEPATSGGSRICGWIGSQHPSCSL